MCASVCERMFSLADPEEMFRPAAGNRFGHHANHAWPQTVRADLTERTIPVFAFALNGSSRYSVFRLLEKLREHAWQVPAYTMPPKVEDLAVLWVVVREGFSRDLPKMFLAYLAKALEHFAAQLGHKVKAPTPRLVH